MRYLIFFVLLISTNVKASRNSASVIYGNLDTRFLADIKQQRIEFLARSVAIVVDKYRVKTVLDDALYSISTRSLARNIRVCEENPWYKESVLGRCSATLIGEDRILTAGHCIRNAQWDCDQKQFLFDFRKDYLQGVPDYYVDKDQIYGCEKIEEYENDPEGLDYAIIKLKRKVQDREPLRIPPLTDLADDDSKVFMIGHPHGLSSMVSSNGRIRYQNPIIYSSNLDSFGGNSGGPVFSQENFKLLGILIRGHDDFVEDQERKCLKDVVCHEDECDGEEILKLGAIPFLKNI